MRDRRKIVGEKGGDAWRNGGRAAEWMSGSDGAAVGSNYNKIRKQEWPGKRGQKEFFREKIAGMEGQGECRVLVFGPVETGSQWKEGGKKKALRGGTLLKRKFTFRWLETWGGK